jgi:beta-galactosidase
MPTFEIRNGQFLHDNNPRRLLSGAVHYFRVHPDLWHDRLHKLKALGCNTVETYVAWNMHEPVRGEYNFSGICDLGRFIKLAGENGLQVIVRPGPFICAEWEFGGLPAWLLTIPGIRLSAAMAPGSKFCKWRACCYGD